MDTTPLRTGTTGEHSANTLPIPLTSFVGRTEELDLAQSLLRGPERRLLTLTGPGGIGKTRLAIEIATRLAVDYADGVYFVPLAAVQHPSMVMPAIASALGLRELDSESAPAAVAATLGTSRRLVLVDNFEHVLEAAPSLTHLLSQCPNVQILATSRSLLRVEGEHAIPVPSLTLPHPVQELTHDEWLDAPVIQLFIERARAIDPGHAWDRSAVAQLVEICARLDGLPLAIELAATKMRHLTLTEIHDRLDERLPLLVGGSRDHPSRLQTMRNAIEWSHDLLSAAAQMLFRRLAVFHGGFSLDAIEHIAVQLDSPDGPGISTSDCLAQLIDASLLLREVDPISGGAHYRMLETIREYAGERLTLSAEMDATHYAHAAYFTQFAERYELADLMPSSAYAIEHLMAERPNLQAALNWLEQQSETQLFLRLVAAHGNVWATTANYNEAAFWQVRALARIDGASLEHRAKIQVQLGMTRLLQGDISAAEPQFAEGLATCRAHGAPYYAALALLGLATAAILQGNNERATEFLLECRETAEQIPDRRLAEIVRGMVSLNLGVVSRASGNSELAAEQITDMLNRARAEDYMVGMLIALGDLGDLARDRSDWSGALSFYKEALELGKHQPIKRTLIEAIESVAIVAFQTGQLERSATLLGAARALRERTGLRYIQPESSSSLAMAMEGNRAHLGEAAFAAAWEAGRDLSADGAIAAALGVPDRAPSSSVSSLTPRETEIVRLLILGMTDPEIAESLFISVRTVENHVAHILAKLDVHTRTAAVSSAIASGLLTSEPR